MPAQSWSEKLAAIGLPAATASNDLSSIGRTIIIKSAVFKLKLHMLCSGYESHKEYPLAVKYHPSDMA